MEFINRPKANVEGFAYSKALQNTVENGDTKN